MRQADRSGLQEQQAHLAAGQSPVAGSAKACVESQPFDLRGPHVLDLSLSTKVVWVKFQGRVSGL